MTGYEAGFESISVAKHVSDKQAMENWIDLKRLLRIINQASVRHTIMRDLLGTCKSIFSAYCGV